MQLQPFLPLFNSPLHRAMLQKIAMTRRFICWHHGMLQPLQPLRWLDVTSTVAVGQRCQFSTENWNKFTVPQVTPGRSSHFGGPSTQQPWMKTWNCQVRRLGEDVGAPRVAAQMDLGSVDPSAWKVYHTDEDVRDEKQNCLGNELSDAMTNGQNRKSWDNKPVRGRGRVVKWTNLLTSEAGAWPSIAAAATELGVSPWTVARRSRKGSQIGDCKVEFAGQPVLLDCEKGLQLGTQETERKIWTVSNYGRLRDSTGRLTRGFSFNTGYLAVKIFGEIFLAHRVVAQTFLGDPFDKSAWQVHHRDGNPHNNRLENLTYTTSAQNIKSSYDNPSRGNSGPALSSPVIWKNVLTSQRGTWPSIRAAARELGVSTTTIFRSCHYGIPTADYQLTLCQPTEPALLEGEKWLPMAHPDTGLEVSSRQVSSHGRLKSARGLITRGHQTKSRYIATKIGSEPFRQTALVHRLVARAFLGAPPSLACSYVNHKDLNPSNNCLENLEYVTRSENILHFHANRGFDKGVPAKAILGRSHGSEDKWVQYPSMKQAAGFHGVSTSAISKCARGFLKQVRGYEFRLIGSEEPADLPGEEWRPVDFEALRREKAERKGRHKQTANGGKTSTWNAYPDMSGMVENNAFPPGVSIHVPLILWNLRCFCCKRRVSREPGAKKRFCDPWSGFGPAHQLQGFPPFLKDVEVVSRMKRRIFCWRIGKAPTTPIVANCKFGQYEAR